MVLFTSSCQAQGNGEYQVIGQVKGLPEKARVYLINGSQLKFIDSAAVQNGQFRLHGHLGEPAHMYLHAGRGKASKKLADILLDNSIVYVNGTAPVYDSVRVSGSVVDQQWKEWLKDDEQLGRQRYQLKQVAQSLRVAKDTANANSLTRLVKELQTVRVSLLKAYVKRYHDTAAGAALPTLCTLEPSLTGNDYLEMYHCLTPTWQKSSFGKEIIKQATKKGAPPTTVK